jgi:flavodoxin I
MEFQVIYFSKTGNTKKVAEAIASELGVKAEDVNDAKLNEDALVFLGSGCYGGKPAEIMTKFIEDSNFKSRTVVLFGTSASGKGMEVKEMENVLNTKEACITGKFFCKGKFLLVNRGRPSDEDFDEAKTFAKLMIK